MSLENIITTLTNRQNIPLLPHKVWDSQLTTEIKRIAVHELVRAGLHLWNDDIHHCHMLAQAHENADGNYWHAILHRREADYSNAKYWYRRVGEHPVIHQMQSDFTDWDPFNFVDQCAQSDTGSLRKIQRNEMKHLLDHVRKKYDMDFPETPFH